MLPFFRPPRRRGVEYLDEEVEPGVRQRSHRDIALSNRLFGGVHAVRADSTEKYSAVTNVTGGFSIKVPPGDYRLQVDLRDGERVLKDPGTVHINKSDLDANLEIVLGS